MKISLILVSYNTSDLLKKSLESIFSSASEHDLQVIVVDNASQDDSCEMLKQQFPQVQLIENSVNWGFAAACNQAQKISEGDYTVLLNSDAWIEKGALDSAVQFMETHPRAGIVGGQLLKPDGTKAPSARRFPSMWNKVLTITGLSQKYPQSRFFGRPDYTHISHDKAFEVDWVPGAFTIFRSSLLQGLGMFDERFYMYFEEVDLCLRAKKAGWSIHFSPDFAVVHIGGASSMRKKNENFESSGAQLMKFRMRSEALYFRKNYGFFSVIGNMGFEWLWNGCIYLYNLRNSSPKCIRRRCEAYVVMSHITKALKDTKMGLLCPQPPW